MTLSNEEFKKHLLVLDIEDDITSVTTKTVNVAFRKLALILHPDKAGDKSTTAFQELLDSCEKLLDHLKEKHNLSDESIFENDHEEMFFKDNFHRFNFPFANKGSFTVTIEDVLANTWQECLERYLGEPKVVINGWGTECDRLWKVQYGEEKSIEITIHIYNKPKNKKGSKLMLQGSIQSLICSYVFNELPKIYKMVCDDKPKPLIDEKMKKPKKKTPENPMVKCDQCKFKSSMIQMKMHIQNVHTRPKPRRALKRLPAFTPCMKPSKKRKDDLSLKFDKNINSEGMVDESIFLIADDTNISEITLEETVPEDRKEENNVEISGLYNCDLCDFDTEYESELKEHKYRGLHMTESHETFNCDECNFSFKSETSLNKHTVSVHEKKMGLTNKNEVSDKYDAEIKETTVEAAAYICGQCGKIFADLDLCNNHMETHLFRCYRCNFESDDQSKVKKHEKTEHGLLKCNKTHEGDCKPVNSVKSSPTSEKCDQCSFTAEDVSALVKHIRSKHSMEHCQSCDHVALDKDDLQTHMIEEHEELVILHTMAQQVNNISESFNLFETFKVELGNVVKSLLETQNAVKQELFLIRNKQAELASLVYKPMGTEAKPNVEPTKPTSKPTLPPTPPPPAPSSSSSSRPPTPLPPVAPRATAPRRSEKKKILFIGDSISGNVDMKALENSTQSKFVTAKAYSSIYDTVVNVAKQAARFPRANFADVVPAQLSKDNYNSLVLQAGSVDVTNLNTRDKPSEYIEYFRQETVISAKNLFQVAENAVHDNPTLEKVLVMKQIPRYDPAQVDPLSLKPALSQLYNNTITDQWMKSKCKDKIVIGSHNIECTGAIKEARYRETKTGKYDGIHLYGSSGRKAYTLSVINILKCSGLTSSEYDFHQNCPQYKYQMRQNRPRQDGYKQQGGGNKSKNTIIKHTGFTLSTENRFDSLTGLNQGNC